MIHPKAKQHNLYVPYNQPWFNPVWVWSDHAQFGKSFGKHNWKGHRGPGKNWRGKGSNKHNPELPFHHGCHALERLEQSTAAGKSTTVFPPSEPPRLAATPKRLRAAPKRQKKLPAVIRPPIRDLHGKLCGQGDVSTAIRGTDLKETLTAPLHAEESSEPLASPVEDKPRKRFLPVDKAKIRAREFHWQRRAIAGREGADGHISHGRRWAPRRKNHKGTNDASGTRRRGGKGDSSDRSEHLGIEFTVGQGRASQGSTRRRGEGDGSRSPEDVDMKFNMGQGGTRRGGEGDGSRSPEDVGIEFNMGQGSAGHGEVSSNEDDKAAATSASGLAIEAASHREATPKRRPQQRCKQIDIMSSELQDLAETPLQENLQGTIVDTASREVRKNDEARHVAHLGMDGYDPMLDLAMMYASSLSPQDVQSLKTSHGSTLAASGAQAEKWIRAYAGNPKKGQELVDKLKAVADRDQGKYDVLCLQFKKYVEGDADDATSIVPAKVDSLLTDVDPSAPQLSSMLALLPEDPIDASPRSSRSCTSSPQQTVELTQLSMADGCGFPGQSYAEEYKLKRKRLLLEQRAHRKRSNECNSPNVPTSSLMKSYLARKRVSLPHEDGSPSVELALWKSQRVRKPVGASSDESSASAEQSDPKSHSVREPNQCSSKHAHVMVSKEKRAVRGSVAMIANSSGMSNSHWSASLGGGAAMPSHSSNLPDGWSRTFAREEKAYVLVHGESGTRFRDRPQTEVAALIHDVLQVNLELAESSSLPFFHERQGWLMLLEDCCRPPAKNPSERTCPATSSTAPSDPPTHDSNQIPGTPRHPSSTVMLRGSARETRGNEVVVNQEDTRPVGTTDVPAKPEDDRESSQMPTRYTRASASNRCSQAPIDELSIFELIEMECKLIRLANTDPSHTLALTSNSIVAKTAPHGKAGHGMKRRISSRFQRADDSRKKTRATRDVTIKAKAAPVHPIDAKLLLPIGQPQIHVLLSPGTHTAPKPNLPTSHDAAYTVCVMGLHRSGTHAMVDYLNKFFDVDVEPKVLKGKDTGKVMLPDGYQIWKHTVPFGTYAMPHVGTEGGPVIVLLMIRDVASWMHSLSQHAYEIFPCQPGRKKHRKQGALWWMFEQVEIRTHSEESFRDPFGGARFRSVPSLWAMYAHGYLSGTMAAKDGQGPTFIILRFEDLVLRPEQVMEELKILGLPRNAKAFEPTEETVYGSQGRHGGRSQLREHVQRSVDGTLLEPKDYALLESKIALHKELQDLLGYRTT